MRITHENGIARRAFCWADRPAVRAARRVVGRDRSAVRTARGETARHRVRGGNAARLPGGDQIREIVLFGHEVEMDSVLNACSDVRGDEGQYLAEGWIDRIAVAFGVFIHPVGEGLDD